MATSLAPGLTWTNLFILSIMPTCDLDRRSPSGILPRQILSRLFPSPGVMVFVTCLNGHWVHEGLLLGRCRVLKP